MKRAGLSVPSLAAVVLGLTIICALLAGALVLFMSWPKSASVAVALLWFMVMVLMFLGTGRRKPEQKCRTVNYLGVHAAVSAPHPSASPPSLLIPA